MGEFENFGQVRDICEKYLHDADVCELNFRDADEIYLGFIVGGDDKITYWLDVRCRGIHVFNVTKTQMTLLLKAFGLAADGWNRASYLGLRESLCEEWQPRGGIELSMIDTIAQAWLQLQFWTMESVKRAKTEPRRENDQFCEWKKWNMPLTRSNGETVIWIFLTLPKRKQLIRQGKTLTAGRECISGQSEI